MESSITRSVAATATKDAQVDGALNDIAKKATSLVGYVEMLRWRLGHIVETDSPRVMENSKRNEPENILQEIHYPENILQEIHYQHAQVQVHLEAIEKNLALLYTDGWRKNQGCPK